MRHSPEDYLVEQIFGLDERLVTGLPLALAVQQVGEVDDEPAFLGRNQIDGPCRRIGHPLHAPLLSQVADRHRSYRHSRESGNPAAAVALDPRFRGGDDNPL